MATKRRNRGGSLERPRQFRETKKRILVVCEGEQTERQYVKRLAQHFRASGVNVVPCRVEGIGKDPLTVVEYAIKLAGNAARAEDEDEYECVWCIVDVDDHETLKSAIELAAKSGVKVAISNPCFELWLYLHYGEHTRYVTTKQIKRKLATKIPNYDKNLPYNFPFGEYGSAQRRAASIAPNVAEPSMKGPNPSTTVWLAVVDIQQAGMTIKQA